MGAAERRSVTDSQREGKLRHEVRSMDHAATGGPERAVTGPEGHSSRRTIHSACCRFRIDA
jgi:hypothetical protein